MCCQPFSARLAGSNRVNASVCQYEWARGARIVQLVLASQERLTATNCVTLLGGNYFRIDQAPSLQQPQLQALDQVDDSTTTTLVKLAEVALANAKATAPTWAASLF
jgi:hypothetical protein